MTIDLRDRLADLAEDAPTTVGTGRDLWRQGVRRRRRRTAAGVGVAATVVALVGVGLPDVRTPEPAPADSSFSELHLPRTVYAPDPWTEGTAEAGPPGPLAAIGYAQRNLAEGVLDVREVFTLFGVSAVDGRTVFLDLPASTDGTGSTRLGYGVSSLSPDGTKIGYVRYEEGPGRDGELGRDPFTDETEQVHVVGWNVYDTLTGEVTELRVPGMPEIRGTDMFELEFSGDSQYLLTNFSLTGSQRSRDDSFVAWDVDTGEQHVVEGTGHHWLPEPAPAPTGVAWTRGRQIFHVDPSTGERSTLTAPRELVTASFGPDGRAIAYVGHRPAPPSKAVPWRLYAGQSLAAARRLRIDIAADELLGWRDDRRVVVQQLPDHAVRVVDVVTGDHQDEGVRREGDVMWLQYAADLWRNPLVDGVESSAADPRPWRRAWVQVVGATAGVLVVVVGWRRRRADA